MYLSFLLAIVIIYNGVTLFRVKQPLIKVRIGQRYTCTYSA